MYCCTAVLYCWFTVLPWRCTVVLSWRCTAALLDAHTRAGKQSWWQHVIQHIIYHCGDCTRLYSWHEVLQPAERAHGGSRCTFDGYMCCGVASHKSHVLFTAHCTAQMIVATGWPSVFYGFGALGLVWFAAWQVWPPLHKLTITMQDPDRTKACGHAWDDTAHSPR